MNMVTAIPTNRSKLGPLDGLLRRLVRRGELTIIDSRGRSHTYGESGGNDRVAIRLKGAALSVKLLFNPSLALGEAYMNGRLTIESGDIRQFLQILTSNIAALDDHWLQKMRTRLGRISLVFNRNRKNRARANVAHHYDLSGELYRLFLDADRQYSCAYFPTGEETLEEAQEAKKRHLAAKLLLQPGDTVLDIGSGWGGLALELARIAPGVSVQGITLSTEQLAESRQRAKEQGLADRVRFDLTDYRDVAAQYDRIVSVGMFEHVGTADYDQFFATVAKAMKPGGVAVLHSIGRRSPPGGADPWISKYIFPGGYVPALSEVLPAIERSGLWVTDIEILRLHYADTLRHWYERFQESRDESRTLYDERFCRIWEFYLAACEMLFRQGDLIVFQIQLAHERDDVPLTRDYLTDYERAHPLRRTAPVHDKVEAATRPTRRRTKKPSPVEAEAA
jgi:cyclopropane-fatty-acyl-phospholipid synthase